MNGHTRRGLWQRAKSGWKEYQKAREDHLLAEDARREARKAREKFERPRVGDKEVGPPEWSTSNLDKFKDAVEAPTKEEAEKALLRDYPDYQIVKIWEGKVNTDIPYVFGFGGEQQVKRLEVAAFNADLRRSGNKLWGARLRKRER